MRPVTHQYYPIPISPNRFEVFMPLEAEVIGVTRPLKMCNGAPGWVFSGTLESPTFQPSMRATATEGDTGTVHVCHSFVREGKIQYLNDCTHRMAGTTVDLPDFEELTE